MTVLTHITSISCAFGIAIDQAIHGLDQYFWLEAYPHFFHKDFEIEDQVYGAPAEVALHFECNLPEIWTGIEPPPIGTLAMHKHIDGTSLWQCTIHPGTTSPLKFKGVTFLVKERGFSLKRRKIEKIFNTGRECRVVWHPYSLMALNEPHLSYAPRRSFVRWLLDHF